ncbi:hypothetical protein QFZ36_000391 [Pseudarthrobacter siccitolerans]|uniref:Transposase n=1 Tax=Pseudarthrobacter siccitolerans TaxID=861266 RepID=A0ABU0PFU4_9MICC|nr:hypothetical protein [Pseudarthrobacter siccitolerans]MDQ0672830.1 hypothetical protein [Pseudarthrobacter siccitolerans]
MTKTAMPTASAVKAERFRPAVPEHVWDRIREEFILPTAADLETHFQSLGDPEAMRRAVRVFIDEEVFCPGFQLKNGLLREPVLRIFEHAMTLRIPRNGVAAWMVRPLPVAADARRVDMLDDIWPL